ncbi:protein ORGAN SIZE RELATED 1-like [Manihot esculenta]|uniref:Uncharacterized protein n=1 Tax=Manihot esculenta TaxID=3983 RepID=A0A2C9V6L3_MANES|nr:protein ORGAN SIZE RELATED 1-like [Manihot esculenta]OAY40232.1 hypothetical protein MANES_09G006100v8 [Manihot esculenta]
MLRSVVIMVLLALSLLLLPVVLPPLSPPPLLFLFVPVFIMSVLVLLALSPSHEPNIAVDNTV